MIGNTLRARFARRMSSASYTLSTTLTLSTEYPRIGYHISDNLVSTYVTPAWILVLIMSDFVLLRSQSSWLATR